MNQTLNNAQTEIVVGLKQVFVELVDSTLSGIGGAVKAYGKVLTEEYGNYLCMSYGQDGETARRNLKHLKSQVMELAVKHSIIFAREQVEKILTGVEWAAMIGLKAIVTAAIPS